MTHPAYLTILLTGCLTAAPALAAPQCSVNAIHGLLGSKGAWATMRVSDNDQACGTRLWVGNGVTPFSRLKQAKAPEHGKLTLSDPTRFTYHPAPHYRGPDSFDLIAFGNNRDGSAVTGRLHVAVSVSRHR